MKSKKEILEILQRGVEEIIPEREFKTLIESRKKLIIKAGFDPTSSDLHLGHTVLINKLKQFQDLGHKIIFLIGDFTGQIGDPSGVNETRPLVSKSDLKKNAKTYNKDFPEELQYIVIHGLLHLIGYSHKKNDKLKIYEAELMKRIWNES